MSETFQGHAILVNDKVGGNAGSYLDPIRVLMTITPLSEYYTLSFWAKADVDKTPSRAYFYQPNTTILSTNSQGYTTNGSDGNSIFSLTTEWTYYWVTWKQTPADVPKSIIFGRHMSDSPGKSYYSMPMLVEGNKPATWQPAPEDVQQQITTNTTNITANSKEIALAAKQSVVDTLSQTVTDQGAKLDLTATSSQLKVTEDKVDALNKTVSDNSAQLKLTATSAALETQSKRVDTISGQVDTNTAGITAANGAIELKASNSRVDTLSNTVEQQGIDLKAAQGELKLKITQNDLTNSLSGYATQTWAQNQIKATATELSSTMETVQTQVQNSAVGTNLLLNTGDLSANWIITSISTTIEYDGHPSIVFPSSPSAWRLASQTLSLGKLQNSTQYSVGFWAKADNAGDKAHTELWGVTGQPILY